MKLKNQDTVVVIAGKFKGKKGKITKTLRSKEKIVVEKINLITKHIKKTQEKPGEIVKFEAPIHASNVMYLCPKCNKASRIGYFKTKGEKKQRVCKKCKATVDKKV